MTGAMRVTTSFGGIEAETGNSFEYGSHGDVEFLPTTGSGHITEEVFDHEYADHVSQPILTILHLEFVSAKKLIIILTIKNTAT